MAGFEKDDEGYFIYKDANASKEYNIDYSQWLIDGDTIANVVWTIPNGLVKENEGIKPPENQIIFVKLSGGIAGENYLVTAHITTINGREDDNSFRVIIREQ
jgi:hypothetical protein